MAPVNFRNNLILILITYIIFWNNFAQTQPIFTCLKLTIETVEQCVKYVQGLGLGLGLDSSGIIIVNFGYVIVGWGAVIIY